MKRRNGNSIHTLTVYAIAVICAAGLTAFAQESVQGISTEPETAATSDWKMHTSAGADYRNDANLDNGGKFNVTSLKATLGAASKLNEDLSVNVNGFYSRLSYDFSGKNAFGGTPWEDINQMNASALFQMEYDEQWTLIGGPIISLSEESDADESSVTGGGAVGGIYKVNPDLTLGLAVAVISQIEDDAVVAPIPLVHWQFYEDWLLRTGVWDVSARQGLGAEVVYSSFDDIDFSLGVQIKKDRFRLADSDLVDDGIGEDKNTLVYASANWKYSASFKVQLLVGGNTGGKLTLEDESGDKITDKNYDSALEIGARATLLF